MKFEIETVWESSQGKVYLFCKKSSRPNFTMTDNSKLNGIEIDKYVNDQPRAFDKDGNYRKYLFVFSLKDKNHKDKFIVGEIVTFEP